jgi:hypothetical protein
MSKLTCYCGEIIDLSPHPNKNEYLLFSESLLESILERIVSVHCKVSSVQEFEKHLFELVRRGRTIPFVVDECPNCGRLYVFRDPTDSAAALTYVPAESDTHPVLLRQLNAQERPDSG